jgi:hypothetical protein
MLGVLAVLATAAIAALRKPKFLSISGAARSVIYVASLAAALVLGAISLVILAFSAHFHYVLHVVDREDHKYSR